MKLVFDMDKSFGTIGRMSCVYYITGENPKDQWIIGKCRSEDDKQKEEQSMEYNAEYIEKLIQKADKGKLLSQRDLAQYFVDQYKKRKEDNECETYTNLIKRAENKDIYAMLEIANAYRDGTFVERSDAQYYMWLKKIVDEHQYVYHDLKYLYESDNMWGQQERFHQDELFELIYPYGDSAYVLGLYYLGSSKVEELEQALFYFEAADLCWIPCEQYIDQVKERIESLKNHSAVVEEEENAIIVEIRERLMDEFGSDVWNKLFPQTRKYLITAMFCYGQLYGLSEGAKKQIDFSSTILPMMKALEKELKERFYVQYINFLREEFATPQEYMKKIGIESANGRDAILTTVGNGNISFVNAEQSEKFTMGSFRYCMGARWSQKKDGTFCDCTAIQFAKNVLLDLDVFRQESKETEEIDAQVDLWLWNLVNEVDVLRLKRNDSAHCGVVLNQTDAEFCLSEIITVKKIIRNLVYICK